MASDGANAIDRSACMYSEACCLGSTCIGLCLVAVVVTGSVLQELRHSLNKAILDVEEGKGKDDSRRASDTLVFALPDSERRRATEACIGRNLFH